MTRLGYVTKALVILGWSLACVALGAQLAISHWIGRVTG